MGTGVRTSTDRVAAVSVGVLWGRRHRDRRPEQLPVTQVGVAIASRKGGMLAIEERIVIEGAALSNAPERLTDLGMSLVAFNALRFDWVALDALSPAGDLPAITIDIYSALYPCVSEIVDAEGVSAFPVHGEYGVLHPHRVAETNLGFIPGGGEDAIGEAELAAELWHHFLSDERAVAAGRTHPLEDEQLALLRGERPAIGSEAAWREMLSERPEPTPYRRKTRHQVTFPRLDQRYV